MRWRTLIALGASTRGGRRGYTGARPDVMELIDAPRCVLDVGCGAGELAVQIRKKSPGAKVVGVESDPQLAKIARTRLDYLVCADLEQSPITMTLSKHAPFDCVVMADILEHLINPAELLNQVIPLLAPNAKVVTSIPNIGHYSTIAALLFASRWPMRDRGIHDATHLRFFKRRDILDLLAEVGLNVEKESRNLRLFEQWSWTAVPAKLLDFWPFRSLLTYQYLHRSSWPDAHG